MDQYPVQTLLCQRARWLAELAQAVEEAQSLVWRLGLEGTSAQTMELYGRLEIVRGEIAALRLRSERIALRDFEPDWLDFLRDRSEPQDVKQG